MSLVAERYKKISVMKTRSTRLIEKLIFGGKEKSFLQLEIELWANFSTLSAFLYSTDKLAVEMMTVEQLRRPPLFVDREIAGLGPTAIT